MITNAKTPDIIPALLKRRSVPVLLMQRPGPNKTETKQILSVATRVPDHGGLTPWRIKVVTDGNRSDFSDALVKSYETDTEEPMESRIKKLRAMATAPMICVVASKVNPESKIPEIEQLLSCGAVCQNLTIAATSLGFVTNWLTGPVAYSSTFRALMDLGDTDIIAGFILIGTPTMPAKERSRPSLESIVTNWA